MPKDQKEQELERGLKERHDINDYVDKIVNASCYVYQTQRIGNPSLRYSRCNLIYYWIGDVLSSSSTYDDTFPGIMKLICEELNKWSLGKGNCALTCTNVSNKEMFLHRKTIFDYCYDYKTLEDWSKDSSDLRSSLCTGDDYNKYLSAVEAAYSAINNDCNGKNADPYCNEYKRKYKDYSEDDKLQKLKCTPVSKPISEPGAETASLVVSTGEGNVAPIVSSITALVGLPAIAAFFLYKYNLLPPWINNKFRNTNKRKKRTTTIEGDFDTSTIGGSTLGDSTFDSTEDTSTIYNGRRRPSAQPARVGRSSRENNNHRNGQNRNIAYYHINKVKKGENITYMHKTTNHIIALSQTATTNNYYYNSNKLLIRLLKVHRSAPSGTSSDHLCNVNDLPSQKIYNKFKNNVQECANSSSWKTGIEGILNGKIKRTWNYDEKVCAKDITKAWCPVSNIESGNLACTVICDYFYYWLGEILCNNRKGLSSFKDTMRDIYKKLGNSSGNQCSYITMDNSIDQDLFKYRKLIFDYWNDYKTIWKQIKQECSSGGSSCAQVYATYLSNADSAYRQVQANCGETVMDDFCKKFRDKFKNSDTTKNIPEPGKLKDKAVSKEDLGPDDGEDEHGADLNSCFQQLSVAISALHSNGETELGPVLAEGPSGSVNTTTPTAATISGTLATTAVATISLLLYKYNLLPSWLHNKLGGGNRRGRRGRSTRPNFDDDTLTTADSSTIGSTTTDDYLSTSDSTDDSTDQHLQELPSWIDFYNEFQKGSTKKCDDTCTGNCADKIVANIKTVLDTISKLDGSNVKNYINTIKEGVCYVDNMYKENEYLLNNKRCWFLYFWIGEKLYRDPKPDRIRSNLNSICMLIKEKYKNHGCKLICTENIEKGPFTHRKTLFEFLYDHTALRTLLWNGTPLDAEKCRNYFDKVKAAKEAMTTYCTTNNNSDDYCKNFWNLRKEDLQKELSDLEDALQKAQEIIKREAKLAASKTEAHLSEAVRAAKTTSSLSSIFGTLGMTVTPFLLYKYKPWSSWFGNNFSGNGGRSNTRRKRTIGHEMDTLTEASIVDFTTSSETSSTIDNSTVRPASYIGQPKGRKNNGGRGMVGYQNM
ncbi:KIR protein [Plasmodium coatneyi]|uniref:KIR protein n=1 Tax=Plasmodium coatneyi TaxID=208452 RepID=A0A1B1DZY1_9APIC|nr:KIR protein [Plasmodium coatneyi]ANQ08205.1 KIR protein [Plasmodium coatneyi]